MVFLLLLLVLPLTCSFELPEDHEQERPLLSPEFEQLSAIVSPKVWNSDVSRLRDFYNDIRTDAGRLFLSEDKYSGEEYYKTNSTKWTLNVLERIHAKTCLDAYSALQPSPMMKLLSDEQRKLVKVMRENNITNRFPSNWRQIAPNIHSVITNRRAALKRLAEKALPETAKFVQSVEAQVTEAFLFMVPDQWKTIVKKIALEYKSLSAESKKDLERSFCARNVYNWLNAMSDGYFDQLKFTSTFTEVVGLEVDKLILRSGYRYSESEVESKFRTRAAAINVAAQEYVDKCRVASLVYEIPEELKTEFGITEEMRGKVVFKTTRELLDKIYEHRGPLARYLTAGPRYYINGRFLHLSPNTQMYFEKIERAIFNRTGVLHDVTFSEAYGFTPEHEDNSWEDEFSFPRHQREFEQVFCLQSAMEIILKREIDFSQMS